MAQYIPDRNDIIMLDFEPIKGKEIEEEREAVREYGTADSGASLGDILGAAIRRRRELASGDE